jgi:hypothetical protein
VDVDAAWEEEHTRGIDYAVSLFDGDVGGDVFDFLAVDQDVGWDGLGGGYYCAVF